MKRGLGIPTPSGNAVKDFRQSKTWVSKNGEIEDKPDSSPDPRKTHPSEWNLAHVWQDEIEDCKDPEEDHGEARGEPAGRSDPMLSRCSGC